MEIPPVCWGCKHVMVDVSAEWTEMGTIAADSAPLSPACASFPDGIPIEIYFSGNDHSRPIGGEKTVDGEPILFELDPERGWYLNNRRVVEDIMDSMVTEIDGDYKAPPDDE